MTKDDGFTIITPIDPAIDPGSTSRPFTASREPTPDSTPVLVTNAPRARDNGVWHVYAPGTRGSVPFRYVLDTSHPPRRRPGARTLGGWRSGILAPERALDVLLGGDAPAGVLTPETRIACGLLAA